MTAYFVQILTDSGNWVDVAEVGPLDCPREWAKEVSHPSNNPWLSKWEPTGPPVMFNLASLRKEWGLNATWDEWAAKKMLKGLRSANPGRSFRLLKVKLEEIKIAEEQ